MFVCESVHISLLISDSGTIILEADGQKSQRDVYDRSISFQCLGGLKVWFWISPRGSLYSYCKGASIL